MSELKIILENFRIRENLIRLKYGSIIPPFLPLYCTNKCKIDEHQQQTKELAEQASKELQQLQEEKTEAIKEYYKKQDEKICNMDNRQLLEEIYRGINNE